MDWKKIKQIRVIQTSAPDEFEKQVNSAMVELCESDPVLTIRDGAGFTAIIEYIRTEKILETVADEFHEAGIYYHCKNCPHIDRPMDGRIKYTTCKYAELGRTHINYGACEVFYKDLKAGRIKPIE